MKRFILSIIVTMTVASSSLVACGGGSCLDEFPCNAGDDDGLYDGSYDGTTKADVTVASDSSADAIDDISTIDADAIDDAEADSQVDGSDASDD